LIRHHPALRLLGLAAFLKILLPIESLAGLGLTESGLLQKKWEAVYAWLPRQEKLKLMVYFRLIIDSPG
jgi:hypothetical protein